MQREAAPNAAPASAAALRARGLDLGYNLDHAEALAAFKEAIAADPDAPAGYRLAAATMWITVLFEQGVITVEDYLGQARAERPRSAPTAELDAAFHDYLHQGPAARRTAAARSPGRSPTRTIRSAPPSGSKPRTPRPSEGRVPGSLGAARRAYAEHGRVLELDPARKDAGLIVGMYRYAVSELSVPLRLFAYLSGFRGGREHGLRLIEDAARYPSDVQSNALFTLILLVQPRGPLRRRARRDSAVAGSRIRATGCSGSRPAARRCERNDRPRRASGSRRASRDWRTIRGRGRRARKRAGATPTAPRSSR